MDRCFASVKAPGEVVAKILLADDSGTAQRMGAQILSAEGHEVATVSNGQAAVKMLAKFAPDLIVADVFMPGRTGYELCEIVKSDPNTAWIPVLLIVAPMEPYDATEGQRVKADGLVTKPLDKSNLVETVQALLASCKRPAAPSKKRGAKAAAEPEPEPPPEPAELHELPAEEDPTIPPIVTSTTSEIDIPEELRNQPVSLMGELLEPEGIEREPSVPEDHLEREEIETEQPEEEGLASNRSLLSLVENDSPEIAQDPLLVSGSDQIEPEGMARLFADAEKFEQRTPLPEDSGMGLPTALNEDLLDSPEASEISEVNEPASTEASEPAAPETEAQPVMSPEASVPPNPSWTADRAEVLEEDKRLFGPEPPDWQGLVNLVQEEDQQGHFPAVSSAAAPPTPAEQSAPPETPEPPSRKAPEEPEPEPPAASPNLAAAQEALPTNPSAPPAEATHAGLNDTISMMVPQIAPLDYATVEQIVRETVEEVMPQIIDRISQATGMRFPKKESPKEE